MLDSWDRQILRLLIRYKDKELSTKFIADRIDISPITAKKHLLKLLDLKYVFYKEVGKVRSYSYKKKKIVAYPKHLWWLRYRK